MLSPDDRIFYLVETNKVENGARMIRAYDLQRDGSVTNMRVFHNFYPGRISWIVIAAGLYSSWGLAHEYGFTDIDGSRPDLGRHFDFDEQFKASSKTGFRWGISRPLEARRKGQQ